LKCIILKIKGGLNFNNKVLLTIFKRDQDVMSGDCVVLLQIIIPMSNGYGSRVELIELDETIKSYRREVQSYREGNGKWIKGLGRAEPN
jgi:hypothetical protein